MIFTLVFWPFKMLPKLIRYSARRAKKGFLRLRHIHRISLKPKEAWLRLAIAIAVALATVIAWQLLRQDLKMGIAFSFSSFLAIYSGFIYKSQAAILLVLVGAMLGVLAFSLVPYLLQSIDNSDYIGLVVVLLVMVIIWAWSTKLKWAEVPKDWQEVEVPKTREKEEEVPKKRRE